ncbi:hypothetical protein BDV32DRAFT_126674 [Aspergillus pseudonomiae]|nr:hypothetical protein BDV32DRAFT_126674 [Aspergillus pseudonomiae]
MGLIIHRQHYSILLVPHHDHHSFTPNNPIPWIPRSPKCLGHRRIVVPGPHLSKR